MGESKLKLPMLSLEKRSIMVEDCIFCKIVSGELKTFTIYEDNYIKAFLDINQVTRGHTLIVPKRHYTDLYDIPEAQLIRVTVVAKKLALRYRKVLNVKAVNLLHASGKKAEQSVFHFHMHLVPRYDGDNLTSLWFKKKGTIKIDPDKVFKEIKGVKE